MSHEEPYEVDCIQCRVLERRYRSRSATLVSALNQSSSWTRWTDMALTDRRSRPGLWVADIHPWST